MKFTMLSFLALFSMTAMAACPDLTGVYRTCLSDSEDGYVEPFNIKQSTKGGVTTYTFTDQATAGAAEFSNDGVVVRQTDIEDGVTFNLSTSASCVDDKFIVDVTAVSTDFSSSSQTVMTKTGSILQIVTTGKYEGQTDVITSICEE
jgi:hypothetical protein